MKRWKEIGEGRCGVDEAIIKGGRKPEGVKASTLSGESEKEVEEKENQVPTEEMAAVSIAEGGGGGGGATEPASSNSTSPEGTVVEETTTSKVEPTAATTPGSDKFVDAPIASEGAVKEAVPALTA